MPVAFVRHAVTGKNLVGGDDNPLTPLHDDGWLQAGALGPKLVALCKKLGVTKVQPITSVHLRTGQTWQAADAAFAGSGLIVLPVIADPRIGEIKFLPREHVPTAENPGLFGRVLQNETLPSRMKAIGNFEAERLMNVEEDTLAVVVGHRSTTRLVATVHAGQALDWLEKLPKMNNCEIWLATPAGIEVIDEGYQSARDEYDPRRSFLLQGSSGSRLPPSAPSQ